MEGKEGYGWWLWLVKSLDTVIDLLDPSRGHTVVENHFGAQSRGVLVVDRSAAYQAMTWVKDGVIVLAFCWSHVRRDFIRVGKGWPELKTWALEWLRRIRRLYRLNDGRLAVQQDATAFGEADGCLRQAVATMTTQMETELARADLATPCRKALESLGAHWEGLKRFVDDPRIPLDNNTSERLERGPAAAQKNFSLGVALEWSTDGGAVLDLGHVGAVEAQSPEMADVVLRALCGGRGQGSGGRAIVLAVESERREEERTGGTRHH